MMQKDPCFVAPVDNSLSTRLADLACHGAMIGCFETSPIILAINGHEWTPDPSKQDHTNPGLTCILLQGEYV